MLCLAAVSPIAGMSRALSIQVLRRRRKVYGGGRYPAYGHGPASVAYAFWKKVIMITGVSEEWNDFPNEYRVSINNEVCGGGCFNDPALPINRGWEWCPREKDYACTKNITVEMVLDVVNRIIGQ
jgi:hypothetical protein